MSDTTRHTVDPKFTYRDKRTGKDVVQYQGLLDAAHRAGLVSINTEVLDFPREDNGHTMIVRATVRLIPDPQTEDLRTYQGIGDANAKNVGAAIAPHFIRMAETRAKARALRDALNVGMVTVEELGGDDDDGNSASQPAPRKQQQPQPAPTPRPASQAAPAANGSAETKLAPTDDQLLTIIRNDMRDPDKRKKALHAYYDRATIVMQLNQRVEAVKDSGIPEADLKAAYNHHYERLTKVLVPHPGHAG